MGTVLMEMILGVFGEFKFVECVLVLLDDGSDMKSSISLLSFSDSAKNSPTQNSNFEINGF